ncbi:MAG TPA: helix-turn-helix transcriptional regulator [Acholeplasmataceae bacterium]|nr:helix-turn-helix transcriptional regulator [Acholeplasmataceae bacterium]
MVTEEKLKKTISKNLIKYRKMNNLTQLELAVELNYSDKAISKWERGESLPDIYVLSLIADFYNITVTDLISDQNLGENKKIYQAEKIMSLLSSVVIYTVATIIFVYLIISKYEVARPWLVFIYALPISCFVLLFFRKKWKSRLYNFIIATLSIWTLALSTHLTLHPRVDNIWMIYIVCIPLQLILLSWFVLRIYFKK